MLIVVGLFLLVGCVLVAVDEFRDGPVAGVVPLMFGLVAGTAIAGLGAANLAGPARRPKPLLVKADGVTW